MSSAAGPGSILGGVLGFVGGSGGSSSAHQAARELHRHLTSILLDDEIQVLTTLELNRLATYSYHVDSIASAENDLLETMIAALQAVLGKPAANTTNALLKALAVVDWLITYGSDRVRTEARVLGRNVEALQQYNTILLAQQSSGPAALLLRIKGGGVDQGGPVRLKADRVMRLLVDPVFYEQERAAKSESGSLVPVGSDKKVGFVTDEVRLYLLQRRVQEETMSQSRLKSNLQKPEGGFGSGYNGGRDGKSVVGAAHGIEEMIKKANRDANRFVDESSPSQPQGVPMVNDRGDLLPAFAVGGGGGSDNSTFSEYRAPTLVDFAPQSTYPATTALSNDVDLLDFHDHHGGAAQSGSSALSTSAAHSFDDEDLLGMPSSSTSSSTTAPPPTTTPHDPSNHDLLLDLGAAPSASSDCLMAAASTTSSMSTVVTSNDLLLASSPTPMVANSNGGGTAPPRDPFSNSSYGGAPSGAAGGSMLGAASGLHGLLGSLSLNSKSSAAAQFTSPSIDITPAQLPPAATAVGGGLYPSVAATTPSAPSAPNGGGAFDRFAALDVLASGGGAPSTLLSSSGGGPAVSSYHTNAGASSMGWNPPVAKAPPPPPPSSSFAWSGSNGSNGRAESDGGGSNGFVMGGSSGTGLFPLGPAPAAPPPPPPPPPPSAGASTFSFY